MGGSGSVSLSDDDFEEAAVAIEHELPPPSRLWHRERRQGVGADGFRDHPVLDLEEDDYDPTKPEYVTPATPEEVAKQSRQMLTQQIKCLDRALAFWTGSGSGDCEQITDHYRQVRAELCEEVASPAGIVESLHWDSGAEPTCCAATICRISETLRAERRRSMPFCHYSFNGDTLFAPEAKAPAKKRRTGNLGSFISSEMQEFAGLAN